MLVRLAFVMMLVGASTAGAATLSVQRPAGWTVRAPDFSAVPGLHDARRYSSPDERVELIAYLLEARTRGTSQENVDNIITNAIGTMQVLDRDIVEHDGRTIGDVIASNADGIAHVRAIGTYEQGKTVVVVAHCYGPPDARATCDRAVATLDLKLDPEGSAWDMFAPAVWFAVGVVALGLLWAGISRLQRRRRLARSVPLVDGDLVTLTGIVRVAGPSLEAPLSGRSCVAHRSRARVCEANGVFVEELEETVACAFELETSTGRVTIVDQPLLDLVPSPIVPRDDARELAFLTRHGHGERHRHSGFDEIVVQGGATISVEGVVRLEIDPTDARERGYRDAAPTTIRLVAPPDKPLAIRRLWS